VLIGQIPDLSELSSSDGVAELVRRRFGMKVTDVDLPRTEPREAKSISSAQSYV
jgi:hypothetical protein